MSAAHQGTSQQSSSSTWTEPPWSGWIETTGDALLILEAARRGLIPRVTRRLVDSERKMITSGSVFVFDEDESGIKRWTDGFFWSPSRILGNFLLYRETDKRGSGHRGARSDSDTNDSSYNIELKPDAHSLSRPKHDSMVIGLDKNRERSLMGSLTNSYKFKPDGLMKKTFSLTIGGVAQHLISYYKIEDVENGRLRSPSSLPELASLDISPEYLDKTHFRNPPKVEIGADGIPRYRGEGDELDPSPPPASSSMLPAPLASGLPLLTEGHVAEASSSSRSRDRKRYVPYGSSVPVTGKRTRKNTKTQQDTSPAETPLPSPVANSATVATTTEPSPSAPHAPPAPIYADPNVPAPPGSYPYAYYPAPMYPPQGAGHIYPQSSYPMPPPGAGAPNTQQGIPQYSYPGYAPAPPSGSMVDASQPGQPAQPYYSYYPPPHPGYAPYATAGWATYPPAGYVPQPAPTMTQHQASPTMSTEGDMSPMNPNPSKDSERAGQDEEIQ